MGDFHNPYNFVPAPPREGPGYSPDHLGDSAPAPHGWLGSDLWTGRIRVSMEVVSPLLLLDTSRVTERDGHKTFDVLVGGDHKPRVPETTIKGMLRAAFEAVTNSRFGVFSKTHARRLGLRMEAKEGLRLVPARVVGDELVLMRGASHVNPTQRPDGQWEIPAGRGGAWPPGLLHAAWMPGEKVGYGMLHNPMPPEPRHGTHVWAYVRCRYQGRCRIWLVDDWVPYVGGRPKRVPEPVSRYLDVTNPPQPHGQWVEGWLCITEKNVKNKHYERLFFTTEAQPPRYSITPAIEALWGDVITNYREQHDEDSVWWRKRPNATTQYAHPEDVLGDEPGKTAWSRHIFRDGKPRRQPGGVRQPDDLDLRAAQLVYVALDPKDTIIGIYPVMIARKLYALPPDALLPKSLQPATAPSELSPADRVFGWVHPGGHGAHRGQLRVRRVECVTEASRAIRRFSDAGLPLAILGRPKPQQGRFYVAADESGKAQAQRLDRTQAGYSQKKGLRGRKVYPHQRVPSGHWDDADQERGTQSLSGWFQEYRRRGGTRDTQNRSVTAWVQPDTCFTFDLDVVNLSRVELGALLWLLDPASCLHHKLGGGKPLGFGSVRLSWDRKASDLRTGIGWQRTYESLWETPPDSMDATSDAEECIKDFRTAVEATSTGTRFEQVPFIAAFKKAAVGHEDRPTHYPRVGACGQRGQAYPATVKGEAFKWFVANDRGGRHALSDLATDQGLPRLYEDPPRHNGG